MIFHQLIAFFITGLITINQTMAIEAVRVDKDLVEEFIPFTHKYELIIADNCVHCMKQLEVMKECVKEEEVIVLLDNLSKLSDEKLRRLVRKKKITYKTYLIDSEIRKIYDFKGVTPVMWMNAGKHKTSYVGVVSCSKLKEI